MSGNRSFDRGEFKLFGHYRARVVEVDIEEDGEVNKYGAVRVFIPDLFVKDINDDLDEFKDGILAYPGNSYFGGYNKEDSEGSSHYGSSVFVPTKNSYVVIEFENGDITKPYYIRPWFGKGVSLPPENRNVEQPHKVYTIIKSVEGRSIIVSDSPDVARVELTGKKRQLSDGPEGNPDSVYNVDGNQTTILLDEVAGREKVLIRTYKGDYLNIDVENRSLNINFDGDISINTNSKFSINAKKGVEISSGTSMALNALTSINIRSEMMVYITSMLNTNIRALGTILMDGIQIISQTCLACVSRGANPSSPSGDRGDSEAGAGSNEVGPLVPSSSAPPPPEPETPTQPPNGD